LQCVAVCCRDILTLHHTAGAVPQHILEEMLRLMTQGAVATRPHSLSLSPRCVAVCCSVLQCVALCHIVCCSVLQSPHACTLALSVPGVLQCVAVCCSVLHCLLQCVALSIAVCCSVLQRVVVCCIVCCSVLQCVAVLAFNDAGGSRHTSALPLSLF